MLASRRTQLNTISMEISELEQFHDYAEATSELFQTKRDNILLEAELHELVERNKFLSAIKTKLDDAVREVAKKKHEERAALIQSIMAGVMNELKDKKLQDAIVTRCLVDLERIPSQNIQQSI